MFSDLQPGAASASAFESALASPNSAGVCAKSGAGGAAASAFAGNSGIAADASTADSSCITGSAADCAVLASLVVMEMIRASPCGRQTRQTLAEGRR